MRLFRLGVLIITLGGGAIAVLLATRRPRLDRDWAPDHERLPRVAVADSLVRIEGLRRFRFRSETDYDPGWTSDTYDLRTLRSVWLVLTPFSKAWRGPAHSFVSFGFDDSTYVAVSIEARRERDEAYGLWRGLRRNFELIYVIGDEADLIGRRALGGFDVYLYPVRAAPEKARALFVDMLARAEGLRTAPEFYNTLTNNCTSELVRHVNRIAPGRIPAGLKLLFPGYADEVARSLGLLDASLPLEAARARYRVNTRARAALADPAFSRRIRS